LTSDNALGIIQDYDVVIDGTDNFPTRYLVNDACVMLGKPNVYGSIYRFEGQVSVFWAEKGPCYRCLYPTPPPPGLVPSCAEGGVLGVLPGVVGAMQANEAIKVLLDIGNPLVGRLLLYDALEMEFMQVTLRKDPACVVCGPEPTVKTLIDYEEFCGVPRDGGQIQTTQEGDDMTTITATQVKQRLDANEDLFLLDVRQPMEAEICTIAGGVLIPMNDVPRRVEEIPKDREIVCFCRTGARSGQVAAWLRGQGYERVRNLTGGMHAWIDEVDPTLVKY
jgi:adenylyltransferase/sulfurtransferase